MEAEAEEGEKFESGYNTISNRDTPEFLRELNLVLILSFLSLSSEERLDSQVIKPKDLIKHPNPKGTDSSLHVPKVNDFRPLERKTHKFQTKIRDCRYDDIRGSWLGTRRPQFSQTILSHFFHPHTLSTGTQGECEDRASTATEHALSEVVLYPSSLEVSSKDKSSIVYICIYIPTAVSPRSIYDVRETES